MSISSISQRVVFWCLAQ